MSEVTLELSESLEHHLQELAIQHGVSLQEYILQILRTQALTPYSVESQSEEAVSDQREQFSKLLEQLGQASFREIELALSERESVKPEAGLSSEVLRVLQRRLSQKQHAK